MSGTLTGGIKARDKNLAKDPSFYAKIGSKGGKAGAGKQKGFAADHDIAVAAGAKAGKISKRGRKFIGTYDGYNCYENLKTGNLEKYLT